LDYPTPSAALIKATLLNGSRRLTGSSAMLGSDIIPNNNQGYGMLDMLKTIPGISSDFRINFCDTHREPLLRLQKSGEERKFQLQVNDCKWIRACLVFVDNPAQNFQNDLDLIIMLNDTTEKWSGNAGINARDPDFSDADKDFTNNIEIARIEKPKPGIYTIMVVSKTKIPRGDGVAFALVITTDDMGSQFTKL
jgi:hypothetical protein